MAKRQWIIGSTLVCLGATLIIAAIVLPIVLHKLLTETVNENIKLTDYSKWKIWGEVPGDMEVIMLHEYHFFSLDNPDDVIFNGEIPIVTEMNGYTYQEFDT